MSKFVPVKHGSVPSNIGVFQIKYHLIHRNLNKILNFLQFNIFYFFKFKAVEVRYNGMQI